MRKILGRAGAVIAAAALMTGLAVGTAHASDDCEGQSDGTIVTYTFNNPDGSSRTWVFECYGGGRARFVGQIVSQS